MGPCRRSFGNLRQSALNCFVMTDYNALNAELLHGRHHKFPDANTLLLKRNQLPKPVWNQSAAQDGNVRSLESLHLSANTLTQVKD